VDRDGDAIASAVSEGDRDTPFDERHVVTAPGGTRTIFETTGRTQTIRDGETGETLARATWGPNGRPACASSHEPRTDAIPPRAGCR
jgi:hypothetical protein